MHCKSTSISARTEKRQSHAVEQSPFRVFSTSPTTVRRQLKRTRYRKYYCRLDQLSDILGTGLFREDLDAAQKSRGFFGPRRSASGRDQGPRMKRSSFQQLKLRTRCARCHKLGHWARECPEGNRGQRNDERYDRRAVRLGENSKKGSITLAKPTERRPCGILEKSCGILVPKRDSSGNSNLTNGVNCSRNTVSRSNEARRSQNPQVESEA